MDNQRMFIWGAVALVWFFVYQAWVVDHTPAPVRPQANSAQVQSPAPDSPLPVTSTADDLPSLSAPGAQARAEQEPAEQASTTGSSVRVVTDVFDLLISTAGGDIKQLELRQYPVAKNQPNVPVRLLDPSVNHTFVFQTGLRIPGVAEEPTHLATYSSASNEYRLADGEAELQVPLTWTGDEGITVTKIFTFTRGSYEIGLDYEVANATGIDLTVAPYLQIRREPVERSRSMSDVDSYSFIGPVLYNGEKYQKMKPADLAEEPVSFTATGGWIASIQHHFLVAAIPHKGDSYAYKVNLNRNGQVLETAIGAPLSVAAGSNISATQKLFAGPKLQKQLEATAPGLKLTVDYGWLTVISQPLFWVLSKIHGITGNWGWSIILLTMLIKLVFYKLQETSGRSMAKMRNMQPRVKHLQERYKDDRQALSGAMMELYRKEKVNPAAGCLPIVVQMPVFIALYWVLIESVEMRQAPFALWLNDLSSKDPYFVLPVLMGITMFFQQKLNPTPPDPIQAKVMMAMPIVFTVFFAFFPSGLVLYWFVNNLLSIAQQWRINKVVAREH
jgi:YidC/Oxa1 family membrane protein insertase